MKTNKRIIVQSPKFPFIRPQAVMKNDKLVGSLKMLMSFWQTLFNSTLSIELTYENAVIRFIEAKKEQKYRKWDLFVKTGNRFILFGSLEIDPEYKIIHNTLTGKGTPFILNIRDEVYRAHLPPNHKPFHIKLVNEQDETVATHIPDKMFYHWKRIIEINRADCSEQEAIYILTLCIMIYHMN